MARADRPGRGLPEQMSLPVRQVVGSRSCCDGECLLTGVWPGTIPAVRQLLSSGMTLGRLTVLVGGNGAGKSTVVEAVAMAYGMAGEGGSTGANFSTQVTESSLNEHISLIRGIGSPRWGYFVRAETMHGLFSYLQHNPGPDPAFHRMSHGESFLALLTTSRFDGGGFFVLDEPEAGLGFEAQLALVGELIRLSRRQDSQVLLATHSPVLAATPGAMLIQLDETGFAPLQWEDLDVVDHYRAFLNAPERYLRHLE